MGDGIVNLFSLINAVTH